MMSHVTTTYWDYIGSSRVWNWKGTTPHPLSGGWRMLRLLRTEETEGILCSISFVRSFDRIFDVRGTAYGLREALAQAHTRPGRPVPRRTPRPRVPRRTACRARGTRLSQIKCFAHVCRLPRDRRSSDGVERGERSASSSSRLPVPLRTQNRSLMLIEGSAPIRSTLSPARHATCTARPN